MSTKYVSTLYDYVFLEPKVLEMGCSQSFGHLNRKSNNLPNNNWLMIQGVVRAAGRIYFVRFNLKVWPVYFDSKVKWRSKTHFLQKCGVRCCVSEAALNCGTGYTKKIKSWNSNFYWNNEYWVVWFSFISDRPLRTPDFCKKWVFGLHMTSESNV